MKINNENGCRFCGHAHWWAILNFEVLECAHPTCKCKAEDYMPEDNLEYLEQLYDRKVNNDKTRTI